MHYAFYMFLLLWYLLIIIKEKKFSRDSNIFEYLFFEFNYQTFSVTQTESNLGERFPWIGVIEDGGVGGILKHMKSGTTFSRSNPIIVGLDDNGYLEGLALDISVASGQLFAPKAIATRYPLCQLDNF